MKTLFVGLAVLLYGSVVAWSDLKIDLWGKQAKAQVTEAWETTGRRGRKGQKIEFTFTDDKGETVTSGASVDRYWQPAPDRSFNVWYVPGDSKHTRVDGKSGTFSYIAFLVGLLLTAKGVYDFYKMPVSAAHKEWETGN